MNRLCLCIVGHLLGRTPGHITTQAQIIADLFISDGYDVISVSSKLSRFARLVDVVQAIVRNRKKINILIVDVFSGPSFILADVACLLGSLFRVPIISVLRGGNLPEFINKFPKWTARVLRRSKVIVAPSGFLSQEANRCGFDTLVIPNVVKIDVYRYRLRQNIGPRMIWMRSFHPIYNPHMALNTLDILRHRYPNATLVMAGVDKGLEREIKIKAIDMGLADSVRFPGFLDMNAKFEKFADADIYLNTNRVDNMPVSVVEACAMGLPVVATDVGGIRHLLSDGANGLLVPDGDALAMSKAVERLLSEPELTKRLSENGRKLADKSSWLSVRPQWESLFAEVLNDPKRGKGRSRIAQLENSVP